MDLAQVRKKLLEAQFFSDEMIKQERSIFIGANPFEPFEPFDHYLSAFLSAARTVDYRLRHEQAAIYPDWRKAWDASLIPHPSDRNSYDSPLPKPSPFQGEGWGKSDTITGSSQRDLVLLRKKGPSSNLWSMTETMKCTKADRAVVRRGKGLARLASAECRLWLLTSGHSISL